MTVKKYRITTKDLDVEVEAESREGAIRNFFRLLKVFWHEWKDKVGQIASVHDEGEEYPFRLVPSLYNMGLIDEETAVANLLRVFEEQPTPEAVSDAKTMLWALAKTDRWMTEDLK